MWGWLAYFRFLFYFFPFSLSLRAPLLHVFRFASFLAMVDSARRTHTHTQTKANRKTVEMSKGWRSYMSSNMRLSHPIRMRKTHSSSKQQCGGSSKQNYTTAMAAAAAAATAMVEST